MTLAEMVHPIDVGLLVVVAFVSGFFCGGLVVDLLALTRKEDDND